jgi:flagellar hook assembly protein FlgD
MPAQAYGSELQPSSALASAAVPVSYNYAHWSEPYIGQLASNYNAGALFEGKNPDAAVSKNDLSNLIKSVIDENYEVTPDSMAREAVVHEFAHIWAKKTGQVLGDIAVIKMLVYSDTGYIDTKYSHSVMVAYMKGIAKGRGDRTFDPKANVTFGELATLTVNTVKAIENAKKPDDQGIVRGRFETRAGYEIKDGKVIFNFTLMSQHTVSKNITFSSGQQFEIVITDGKGEEVYKYSDNKFFTLALLFKTMIPGEALQWNDEWDMTNKRGEKLTAGDYSVKITVLAKAEEGAEKIDEGQLTTTLKLNLAGNAQ